MFWTNTSLIQFTYENSAFVLKNSWSLDVSNITASQIKRIEFCKAIILYLHNGTVFMLKSSSQQSDLTVLDSQIDRYIPGDSSPGDTTSYYLKKSRIYKCARDQTECELCDDLEGRYDDFYIDENMILTSNASFVQEHTSNAIVRTNRAYRLLGVDKSSGIVMLGQKIH